MSSYGDRLAAGVADTKNQQRVLEIVQKHVLKDKTSLQLATRLYDVLTKKRHALLAFLKDHGSQTKLVSLFWHLEIAYGNPSLTVDLLINDTEKKRDGKPMGAIFELPTDELCRSICNIAAHFKITRMLEVAAGTGLLTARLREFKIAAELVPSDKSPDKAGSVFVKDMVKQAFDDIKEANTPVLVSWLHPSQEDSFLKMLARNKPPLVLFVGEYHSGSCHSAALLVKMGKELGYASAVFPTKQLCARDHFLMDVFRPAEATRSVITLCGLGPDAKIIQALDENKVKALVGEANMCGCLFNKLTKEELSQRRMMDIYALGTDAQRQLSDLATYASDSAAESLNKLVALSSSS